MPGFGQAIPQFSRMSYSLLANASLIPRVLPTKRSMLEGERHDVPQPHEFATALSLANAFGDNDTNRAHTLSGIGPDLCKQLGVKKREPKLLMLISIFDC